jgi:predicted PurR-regulated permease PerM
LGPIQTTAIMASENSTNRKPTDTILATAVDLIVKIGVLLVLIFFCINILSPFVNILLWAMIIAIIVFPLYEKLGGYFGKRKKMASLIITILALAILLVPSYWLLSSLVDGLAQLGADISDGSFEIPPPSQQVSEWPLIGNWLYTNWLAASENLGEAIQEYLPQITTISEKLLGALAGTGLGILQFALSTIIAGVLLTHSGDAARSGRKFFTRLAGERGEEFAEVSERTVRGVATGVIGVAFIQSILIGIAMLVVGVPLAGVWIVITLILAIAQLPMLIVTIPMIIWLFAFKEPLPAVLWSIYLLAAGVSDNILKPILMGKGATVPMLVIFLGAIGGFIVYGFLGLFLGAIILSLGYKLYLTWLNE